MKRIILFLVCLFPFQFLFGADISSIRSYFSNAQYGEALREADEVLDVNRYFREALMLRGQIYQRLGENEKALENWEACLQVDPSYNPLLFILARFELDRAEYDKSLEYYDRILKEEPLNLQALLGKAEVEIRRKNLRVARGYLIHAERIDPSFPLLHRLYGEFYLAGNERSEAERSFKQARELSIRDPLVYLRLGEIRFRDKDWTGAEDFLDRSIQLDPENLEPYSLLAQVYLEQKEWSRAYKVFRDAEKSLSFHALYHYNLSVLSGRIGKQALALEHMKKALDLDSEDPFALMYLSGLLRESGKSSDGKELAERFFREARRSYNEGDYNKARLDFRRGLMLVPHAEKERYEFAMCYKRLGYWKTYLNEMKVVLGLDPGVEKWSFQLERDERRFSMEYGSLGSMDPKRSPTRVLILPFRSFEPQAGHLEAGSLLAKELAFYLNNLYRIDASFDPDADRSLFDFVITGEYEDHAQRLSVNCEMRSARDRERTGQYERAAVQNERVIRVMGSLASDVARDLPVAGEIFQIRDDDFFVNLGLLDGFKKGDLLDVYSRTTGDRFRYEKNERLGQLKIIKILDGYCQAKALDEDLDDLTRLHDRVVAGTEDDQNDQ